MTGCSMAAKRMGNDLITGKQKIGDISNSMKTATASTKALGVAMNVFANVGFMLAITAISKVVSELAQAQENAVQTAKEATEAYNDEISSIDDYKTRLSELHEELNSGNLSYEETKTKRTELMSIQDELIEKFGTEKGAIESVTEAINGQVDALDTLNEKSYRDWVAKADEQTFWNQLLPGGKSGLDQAIDYMETDQTVSFYDMQNANLSEELQAIQKEIDETIKSKYNLDKTFAMFNVTGTPEEIKSQLEAIRQDYLDLSKDAFLENGISSEMWEEYRKEAIDSLNEIINKFDDGLKKHQETYQTYIEGMIKYDSEYSDEYATILQKRAELESAQNSGNKEAIQKARQEFMDAINKGISESGSNENIKKYFESLYPELQSEFSSWNFEIALSANTDGLADVANGIGEQYTAVDLLDMVNTEGIQEGEESFNTLIDKAYEYGVITDKSAQEVQKLIDLLVALGYVQGNVQSSTSSELFSSFDNTNLGERLQHASKLFKEGELTHKQYFDSLQNEIDNFDASNFTDSLEDANKASQQFFTDSVQQSASGLSDLINKFDAGEMSVSEYLDGYLAIGETLSTLADNLQENSSAWDKNGEAMSDAVSSGLDSVQSDLDNAMSTITGYKDSIYSLEQIMTGAVKAGSDEFTAHANVIAQDLANIVSSGGEMASEVANTLGTTTSEIASNLTKNVSNQSLAAQAIAANTNIAISNMATSVANIFTTLGNAISNFNVDISFSKTSGSLIDAITGNGELKFNLSASGETLSTIGDAISAFGETLALNIQPQLIEAPDFSLDVDEYTPDVDTLKNYNDELDRLKNSSKGASKSTDALTESMKKQKEALESTKSELEKQKQYYEDVAEAIDWFYDKQIEKQEKAIDSLEKENELLEERIDYYDGALSAIDRYYEKQIEKLEEQKDALNGNNKEVEASINLEKRQQELLEAKSRKTIGLYQKGKGIGYVTDTSAIKTAEENLVDAQRQKEEADIDAKIDKLKEYQALWAEIPSAKQKAEEESQMIEMLGANWESILLEGRIQNITSFKDQYIGLQQQIDNNESMIASYEEKIAYYESLKTEWDNLLAKYTEDTYTQLLIGAFGNDFENELLNGRTDRWTQFAEDYYNIQVQLKDVTDQIESLAKRMEEYASRIESAANSAVKAVNDLANVKIPSIPSVNKSSGSSSSNSISGNKYISSVKAKGGIITKKDVGDFDYIARELGEDHMVALTEGEAVIPKENVAKNPEAIDSLLSGQKLDLKALVNRDIVLQRATPLDTYSMFEKYKDWIIPDSLIMSRLNLPSQDFSKLGVVNNNQQQTVIQINGDLSFPNIKSGNDAELLLNDLSNMANKARQRSARR